MVDESSMASTQQMHTFVEQLKEDDRVLFVGDTRQHEAVEAGRPYAQLQEAGLRTAHLDEIIRQKDPALKEAVEQLARGEIREAMGNLNQQGRVVEIGTGTSASANRQGIRAFAGTDVGCLAR